MSDNHLFLKCCFCILCAAQNVVTENVYWWDILPTIKIRFWSPLKETARMNFMWNCSGEIVSESVKITWPRNLPLIPYLKLIWLKVKVYFHHFPIEFILWCLTFDTEHKNSEGYTRSQSSCWQFIGNCEKLHIFNERLWCSTQQMSL